MLGIITRPIRGEHPIRRFARKIRTNAEKNSVARGAICMANRMIGCEHKPSKLKYQSGKAFECLPERLEIDDK